MIDTIRLVLVSDPSIEVASARIEGRAISYSGTTDVIQSIVEEWMREKENRQQAFDALARKGWSNGYLMIRLPNNTDQPSQTMR